MSECPGIQVSKHPSVRGSEYLSIRVSECPSIRVSECPSIRVSEHPSIRISEYLNIRISEYPSIRISEHLNIRISNISECSSRYSNLFVLVRMAKLIGADRDVIIAEKIDEACRKYPKNSEFVVVIGMLHCNGVARKLLSSGSVEKEERN